MASVKRRPDGKWRARWRDPDGREHAKHFDRKGDAQRFLATVEADKLRGQYVDLTDRTTVAEYARRWAAARPHGPRTVKRVNSVLRCHVEGTSLGARRLSQVLPSEAQAWATGRAQVLAPTSVRNVVRLVRSVFLGAVADRLIAVSPFVKVSLPDADQQPVVPLTVEQVRRLAAAMPARNQAMVITQAGLGLRIGELLGLRKEDVDFLRRVAHVETQIPPGEKTRSDPKTRKSKRPLPLPAFVADALAAHMQQYPPAVDGSIFYTSRGHPYGHSHYGTQIFSAAVRRAGLPAGTTSHDLRHHYASVLLHAGESVVAVAERLGHKNANLVLSTYGHLMPDSEERTRKALDSAWRDADQVRTAAPQRAL